jgi:tetratricopeptide (TPR) repeat protein
MPAASPYKAAPVEQTPAIATATFDVSVTAAKPRPRLRTGIVLAVTAVAVVTGFGLTLLIGRAAGEAPEKVAATRPTPVAPASTAVAKGPTAAEPVAKAAGIERAPVRETAPAVIAERASEPQVPVSSVEVPGCREMLGDSLVEKADPNAALAETQVGNRELVRGKMDASQAAFCKAALWDGAKVERWLNLAQIFLIRRDGNKAVEASGHALELDPKNARALELQGDAFARLGKLKEARIAYLAAEARAEPDEDALKWLVRRDFDEANRSLKSRDFVRAERLFRRVVVFDQGHAAAAIGVATCLRKQSDLKGADDWERHAATLVRKKER